MKRFLPLFLSLFVLLGGASAQVPPLLNYQGRVAVGSTNFNGSGQFRFALVNTDGSQTYWSNDGTSTAGSQPTAAVTLPVANGLYSVLLGDTTIANMTAVPASVFANSDVRLRVWFNDGTNGSQLLSPDQRVAAAGYALMADSVKAGGVTTSMIASGAVGSTQIAPAAVGTTQLAGGSVSATQIADNSITGAKIGTGQVVKSVNGLSDALTLAAGANISITPSGNTLTLASTGGAGVWSLNGTTAYYNGGSVGIGTSSFPAFKLALSSTTGSMLLLSGAQPYITFQDTAHSNATATLTMSSGALQITSSQSNSTVATFSAGYLGLGTTTPQNPLHIVGVTDAIRLTATNPDITFENSSYLMRIQANLGGLDLKTNGALTGSNPNGLLHLDGTGTVGIGTTTPTHQLTIVKNSGTPSWTANGWLGEIALDNSAAIAWAANSAGQRFGMGHTNGAFLLFRTASDPGTTGSAATYDFTISDAGLVGVGTNAPANKLDVRGGSIVTDTNLGVGTTSPADRLDVVGTGAVVAQVQSTTDRAILRLNSTVGGNNHVYTVESGLLGTAGLFGIYDYTLGKPRLTIDAAGTVTVPVLSVTGGADVAEPFPMQEDGSVEKGSVVVIDEAHPGRLKRSTRAYDKRVAGIVSGANGINPGIALHQEGALDGGQNVALSGRVYVLADSGNGEIEPGDMLTSSDVPGRAMKATDWDRAHGAVIGKAMSPLHEKQGTVLVLVTLQ